MSKNLTISTNGGTTVNCSTPNTYSTALGANNVAQNSENLGCLNAFFGQPFDASAPGEYSFSLQALNRAGALVGETDITVTVPEPAPLALISLALVGLGVTSRRRRTRA